MNTKSHRQSSARVQVTSTKKKAAKNIEDATKLNYCNLQRNEFSEYRNTRKLNRCENICIDIIYRELTILGAVSG